MEKLKELNKQNFTDERKYIHKIALMMGDIRENLTTPEADWSHITLEAYDNGIRTPEMTGPINRITYNIIDNDLSFYYGLKIQTINLSGLSSNEIHEMLSDQLQKYNIVLKKYPEYNNEIINKLDRARANFVNQSCFFDGVLKKFHSSISTGEKTPVHLWPHGFDDSFIWKSGKKVNGEEVQLGIGISFGDKYYDLPYVYLTVNPSNPRIRNIMAPRGHFHDEGWEGFVLHYADIQKERTAEEQEKVTMDFLNSVFQKVTEELKMQPATT